MKKNNPITENTSNEEVRSQSGGSGFSSKKAVRSHSGRSGSSSNEEVRLHSGSCGSASKNAVPSHCGSSDPTSKNEVPSHCGSNVPASKKRMDFAALRMDIRAFAALYLLNFVLLGAIFFFLDGFKTLSGLLYFMLLSLFFFALFLCWYWPRKRKQYAIIAEKEADALAEREKASAYERHYREHLLFINRWVHYIKTPLSVLRSITQEAITNEEQNQPQSPSNIDSSALSKSSTSSLCGRDSAAVCEDGIGMQNECDSLDECADYDQNSTLTALRQIQAQSDRILDGVNSALNFARATDFVNDFKIEQFDLYEMFVELINDLKMNFIRSHVYPDLQIRPSTLVLSDRKWLKFIFFQLLTNAIKYSHPEGKVSIFLACNSLTPITDSDVNGTSSAMLKNSIVSSSDLETCFDATNGTEVTLLQNGLSICVSDTGIGIAREDQPRVFDIFFTGTNGRTRGESTGIGLFLAKTICDKLGHTISVTSIPDQMTTFYVFVGDPRSG